MLKRSRIAIALTLAIILSIGALAPMALANDAEGPFTKAAITKVLQMPIGTSVPTGNFVFDVLPVSVNGDTANPPPSVAGAVDNAVTIPFSAANSTLQGTVGDVSTYYMESNELFGTVVWPSAGVFEYTITERPNTVTINPENENIVYSEAKYTVRVFVREDDEGELYIFTIAARRTVTDKGVVIPGGLKVDPTPGGDDDIEGFDYSQMTFNNIYTKHTGCGGNGDDGLEATLTIGLDVDGELASTTEYFDFSITVNQPSLITDPVQYKAFLVDDDGTILDEDNIQAGQPFTFRLRHGQRLVFVDTHVGANYTVTNNGAAGYETSAIITSDAVPGGKAEGSPGEGLTIPDGAVYTSNPLVGEKENKAEFTSTNNLTPDMGLSMSDLPFYGLILLALGGIAAPVAVKAISRNKNK